MLVFWSRFPTIGGPRPETWRWLCSLVAPPPVYYMVRRQFYGRLGRNDIGGY